MSSLIDIIRTPLAFIVVLGVLVSVHEYGHYLAARLLGFRVEAFSLGFGRAIAAWKDKHGTSWQIGWLPLGGYVKLHGFDRGDAARSDDPVPNPWARTRGFHDHSLLARAIVTVAGPAANFVLTLVLFSALFMAMGRPVPTAVLGAVTSGQAADHAGLRAGDKIESINGAAISSFEDLQRIVIAHPAQTLSMRIQRAGAERTIQVTTDAAKTPKGQPIGRLGVSSGPTEYRPIGPLGAIGWGAAQSWYVVQQTADGLWQVITGQRGAAELGGTLRIAQLSGQVAKLGLPTFINFIAVLSVNLGLLNLLPIPVLDGGHLVFYAIEALRGRPLPARAQEYGLRVGFGLIATLVAFSVVNDLTHFGLFHWVAGLIG